METEGMALQRIIPVDIEHEMKKCFIDYAMSVIVDRALPDIRDGLKPVHRRILYAMENLGFTSDKAYRKCAQTVGEVMGKFHPHGDMAIYDSLVRMAQNFSLRYPLVDPHGNFGSRDGDPPAAQRYTEARLSKMGMEMLADINKDTVDFRPNYDGHCFEPVVLPSAFPNLLVNGSAGIAVGMATNIPPHNLTEVIDGITAVIDNPDMDAEALNRIIKGPDFPTYGMILGKQGIREAYETGKGRILVRARAEIEQLSGNRQRIIVTELPYQVNKARLIEKIAELARDKRIDGISGVNDESGREAAVRIVIDLRRDARPNVVLNQLYARTQMQEAFNVNMLAIVQDEKGKYAPMVLTLRKAIDGYIQHRKEVVRRRTLYELEKAESEAHLLEGLRKAIDIIDEVISLIRDSRTQQEARERLQEQFGFSERQAEYIVDMRLGQLTGLEREKLEKRYNELKERITWLRSVLENETMMFGVIKEELAAIRKKYGDERRTEIVPDPGEINDEDLIQEEENVVTLTHFGYIKRLKSDTYRSQRRGGKGVSAMSTREEDFVETLFVTSTHSYILFFTNKGQVLRLKAYELPEAGRTAKGTAIVNLLELEGGEKVSAIIPVPAYEEGRYLVMATRQGLVKKTNLMLYSNIRRSGLKAVNLVEGDELIDVKMTNGSQELILVTRQGNAIRFDEKQVRAVGRAARGVIGINLDEGDYVIGMEVVTPDKPYLLVVTENGFGKRTEVEEYRVQSRHGKGVMTYRITPKTGAIAGMKLVGDEEDVILITLDGNIIRLPVGDVSILSRITQGVTLMRFGEGNNIVGIATAVPEDEDADLADGDGAAEETDADAEAEAEAEAFEGTDASADTKYTMNKPPDNDPDFP